MANNKKAPEPKKTPAVEPTAPVAPVSEQAEPEVAVEQTAVEVEKKTIKAVADSGVIETIIPTDPSLPDDQQFFEHCINGVIYRYRRGVVVEMPKAIFETIQRKAAYQKISLQIASQFKGAGKLLDI